MVGRGLERGPHRGYCLAEVAALLNAANLLQAQVQRGEFIETRGDRERRVAQSNDSPEWSGRHEESGREFQASNRRR